MRRMVMIVAVSLLGAACTDMPTSQRPLLFGPSDVSGKLWVSPPYTRVKVGQRQDFNATGGDGKYEWSLARGSGTLRIQGISGRWYSYQSSVPEEFSIIVKSGDGSQTAETFGIVVAQ